MLTCSHRPGLRKTVWVVPCGHRTCDLVSLKLSTNPGDVGMNPSINNNLGSTEELKETGLHFCLV